MTGMKNSMGVAMKTENVTATRQVCKITWTPVRELKPNAYRTVHHKRKIQPRSRIAIWTTRFCEAYECVLAHLAA